MSSPSTGGRVVCSRCGANNFDTQAACWKCGAPLSGGRQDNAAAAAPPSYASSSPSAPPLARPAAADTAYRPVASPSTVGSQSTVDPAVATWSSIALAVFFPFFAVPVGIVFLMLDDRRKAEVGRITLMWGLLFSVFHFFATFWLVQGTVQQTMNMVKMIGGRAGGGGGAPDPKLTDPVTFPTP